MVGVLVRVRHRVNDPDFFSQQLLPQVGCRVDQQVPVGQAKNRAAPRALIPRMTTRADRAIASNCRNSDGSSTAEQNQFAPNIPGCDVFAWQSVVRG